MPAFPVTISGDPNDPEVQAISAFLRVLNALENIRSSINVAERGRQMGADKDARELAALALAETVDAIAGSFKRRAGEKPRGQRSNGAGPLVCCQNRSGTGLAVAFGSTDRARTRSGHTQFAGRTAGVVESRDSAADLSQLRESRGA